MNFPPNCIFYGLFTFNQIDEIDMILYLQLASNSELRIV